MGCIKQYLVNYKRRAGIDKLLKNAVQKAIRNDTYEVDGDQVSLYTRNAM